VVNAFKLEWILHPLALQDSIFAYFALGGRRLYDPKMIGK
jgi:hypothetical protein